MYPTAIKEYFVVLVKYKNRQELSLIRTFQLMKIVFMEMRNAYVRLSAVSLQATNYDSKYYW